MEEKEIYIIRVGKPSKYDYAPYGSLCLVKDSLGNQEKYIQNSKNEEEPDWQIIN